MLKEAKEHRTRMLVFHVRGVEYIVVFEQAELPDLNVNYVGSEGQFINERFTLKSFPDLQVRLADATTAVSGGNLGNKNRLNLPSDDVIEQFSVELIGKYCDILSRRLEVDVEESGHH